MTGALRVLIVDDNPADRALAARELAGEFPDIRTIEVADATTFETAVERGEFELVITEFRLGWSDGLAVLRELKYRYPEIPVIMFTGAGSEEIAVEAMRVGLDDYVLKGPEHVVGLPVAAAAVLEHARERRSRAEMESLLDTVFASPTIGLAVADRECRFVRVNDAMASINGVPREVHIGRSFREVLPHLAPVLEEIWERVLRTGEPVLDIVIAGETAARPEEERTWLASYYPVKDVRGEVAAVGAMVVETTERTRAEEALRSSEAHLRALFASMSDVILVLDRDGRYLEVAPTSPELLYRPAAETLGKTVHELFAPEQADRFLEAVRKALDTRSTVEIEYMLEIRDEDRWFVASISPMLEDSVVWVARDITERKRAEESLREQAEILQAIFDNVPMMVVFFDASGRLEYWNRACEQTFGWSLEEARSRDLFVEFYPEEEERARALSFIGEASGAWRDFRTHVRDGRVAETTWANVRLSDGRTIGIGIDITERKRAEESLRESEQKLKTIFEVLPVGISILDAERQPVYTNPALSRILGISEEGLARGDHEARSYLRPDRTPMPAEEYASVQAVREGRAVHDVETGIVKEDGDVTWVSVSAAPVAFPDWSVVVVTADITERKRAEEEIHHLATFPRFNPIPIAEFNLQAEVLFLNPAMQSAMERWGIDDARRFIPPDWQQGLSSPDNIQPGADTQEVQVAGRIFEERIRLIPESESLRVYAVDITERKRAEEALRRSEGRVRELLGHLFQAQEEERGRIAGDIHDDSIQVMTAVGLRLGTLQGRLTDPEALETMKRLEETVTSAISRLRHLMFELRPRVLDEDGLAPALRMYLDHMSEQVQIEYTLSNRLEEEPSLTARTVLYRIAQEALVNIRKHANAKRVDVVLEPREAGYAVSITDDGSGFEVGAAEQTLPGHLGLAAMLERAEMVGGWWRIESIPGEGTTVEFWVPAEVD
jgi:PAS domain S-box-containing protein